MEQNENTNPKLLKGFNAGYLLYLASTNQNF